MSKIPKKRLARNKIGHFREDLKRIAELHRRLAPRHVNDPSLDGAELAARVEVARELERKIDDLAESILWHRAAPVLKAGVGVAEVPEPDTDGTLACCEAVVSVARAAQGDLEVMAVAEFGSLTARAFERYWSALGRALRMRPWSARPDDGITLDVAEGLYQVSRRTLKTALKDGRLTSLRPSGAPKNAKQIVSEAAVANLWPKKEGR